MKTQYGTIINNVNEILDKNIIGQRVKIIDKKKADIGGYYYIVEFLTDEFKKYNDLLLAGGGYFNHIYTTNIQLEN